MHKKSKKVFIFGSAYGIMDSLESKCIPNVTDRVGLQFNNKERQFLWKKSVLSTLGRILHVL